MPIDSPHVAADAPLTTFPTQSPGAPVSLHPEANGTGGGTRPSDLCYPKPVAAAIAKPWPPMRFSDDVRVPDGGGCISTADWSVPWAKRDLFGPLRKKFECLCKDWDLVCRLRNHAAKPSSACMLSDEEIEIVRAELVSFLRCEGFPCSAHVAKHQPFLLEAWDAVAQFSGDVDHVLPKLLFTGVSTGIDEPISPSGVWEVISDEAVVDAELLVHYEPWGSALKSPDLTWQLIQKDLDAGHLVEIHGGEQEARARWGSKVAAGKFGVVTAEGRKPRLIGDGTVSGTKDASRIPEKVHLPNLEAVQRFLSRNQDQDWTALSFDVRGAHKLVRVAEDQQGYSCFILDNRWFHYTCCYFGARWSAYWFSRVGSFILRHLHLWIRIAHGAFLYVDDGLCLLPSKIAPLVSCTCIMFLCALGVPLSWEKLAFGKVFTWLGWNFDLCALEARMPQQKSDKLLPQLATLCVPQAKLERRLVEKVIGLLVWFACGCPWLKPWLEPLYHILHKPKAVPRLVNLCQFAEIVAALDSNLVVCKHVTSCDVCLSWRLHSVSNAVVKPQARDALCTPRVRNGQVSLVFFDYGSPRTASCDRSVWAARLFYNAIVSHIGIPLSISEASQCIGAADAFATSTTAGIGGWWVSAGLSPSAANVQWFSFQLSRKDLPAWFRCLESSSLQSCIVALEALAQLVLLVLRCRSAPGESKCVLRFAQLCDNQAVTFATLKMLSTKQPLCYVLQALGFYCCEYRVALTCSHVAGVRNEWADCLSRDVVPAGFNIEFRRSLDIQDLLSKPWFSARWMGSLGAADSQ